MRWANLLGNSKKQTVLNNAERHDSCSLVAGLQLGKSFFNTSNHVGVELFLGFLGTGSQSQ